jgi:hypothetical protein
MAPRPRERHTTFLVASSFRSGPGTIVYAVRMPSAVEALAAVATRLDGKDAPVIVGSLSTRTTKAMGLKPGELRLV